MSTQQTVLLVGGTGRTGRRVLEQLLGRGVRVHAIVRSIQKLPAGAAQNPNLVVVEASLLSLTDEELQRHIRGCDAVISCLGHVISFKGACFPPRDLVTRAATRLCRAIEALQPTEPIKFLLVSSVSVNRPGGADTRRGKLERAFVWMIRSLLPPAKDNQQAADFLNDSIGTANPFVQWATIRPDALKEGDAARYTLHEGLVNSLFAPASTNMANVAHFMCELVTNPQVWNEWKGKLPVIINESTPAR